MGEDETDDVHSPTTTAFRLFFVFSFCFPKRDVACDVDFVTWVKKLYPSWDNKIVLLHFLQEKIDVMCSSILALKMNDLTLKRSLLALCCTV